MENLCSVCIFYYDAEETSKWCKFYKKEITEPIETCDEHFYFEVTEDN